MLISFKSHSGEGPNGPSARAGVAKRVGRVLRFPQLSLRILYVSQILVCLSPCAQKYPTACERRLARTPCVPTALPACVRRGLCVPPSAPPPRSVQAASPRSLPAFRPRARGCRARLTALRRASPAAEKEKQRSQPSEELRQQRVGLPQQASVGGRHAEGGVRILRVPYLQGIESSVGSALWVVW